MKLERQWFIALSITLGMVAAFIRAETDQMQHVSLTRSGMLTVFGATNDAYVVESSTNLFNWGAYGKAIHGSSLGEVLTVTLTNDSCCFFKASKMFTHGIAFISVNSSNVSHLLVTEGGSWAAILQRTNTTEDDPELEGVVLQSTNNTIISIFVDAKGRPSRVISGGTVLLYGNYRSNLVDLAIVFSDGSTNIIPNLMLTNKYASLEAPSLVKAMSIEKQGAKTNSLLRIRRYVTYLLVVAVDSAAYCIAEVSGANREELKLMLKATTDLEQGVLNYSEDAQATSPEQTEDPSPSKVKEYGPKPEQPDRNFIGATQQQLDSYQRQTEELLESMSALIQQMENTISAPAINPPSNMVWITPGTFTMGSPTSEAGRLGDEVQHTATISQGYWMGRYEVTQAEYLAVIGSNPSYFTGNLDRPVEQVKWHEATNYCGKLTQQERTAGRLPSGYEYRLPTEAEWEYACRAGTMTATTYGNSLSSTQDNFNGNYPYNGAATGPSLGKTTQRGSYLPNAWGLFDMHGNVHEWCLEWYSASYRVVRGGAWDSPGWACRSACRSGTYALEGNRYVGFRVVLAPFP